MTNETPEQPEPQIYLGADGQYHDNTPENREQYPSAEDAAADATPVTPDAELPDGGTETTVESGTDAQPGAKAKTRNDGAASA